MSSAAIDQQAATSDRFADVITTQEALRQHMGQASQRSLDKEIDYIDPHSISFIAHSPFVLIATSDGDGRVDVSPKGDPAGFVKVLDEKTLVIPDRPGNRRLDGFENILSNPHIGLIFLVPGRDETLRINGRAKLVKDPELLETMSWRGKTPTIAIAVEVEELFFHCGKAFIRSKLWKPEEWADPSGISSFARILLDQTKMTDTSEEQMNCILEDAYENALY